MCTKNRDGSLFLETNLIAPQIEIYFLILPKKQRLARKKRLPQQCQFLETSLKVALSPFTSHFPIKTLQIGKYTIFYENSEKNLLKYFSKEEAKLFAELVQNVQIYPKTFYQETLLWKEKHPNNPLVDNLLAFIYLQNKEKEKAEKLIEESYKKYPDYLFAKINYADQCLRYKKLDLIPFIFPSFDLSALFPEKSKFHVSEFRGYMTLMSRYHLLLKDKKTARLYYQYAYQADPSHPSLIFLEKQLVQKNLNLFFKSLNLCHDLLAKVGLKKH